MEELSQFQQWDSDVAHQKIAKVAYAIWLPPFTSYSSPPNTPWPTVHGVQIDSLGHNPTAPHLTPGLHISCCCPKMTPWILCPKGSPHGRNSHCLVQQLAAAWKTWNSCWRTFDQLEQDCWKTSPFSSLRLIVQTCSFSYMSQPHKAEETVVLELSGSLVYGWTSLAACFCIHLLSSLALLLVVLTPASKELPEFCGLVE